MRIIGLDVGSKTIGVAVSDELGWTAQGKDTVKWEESLERGVKIIGDLVKEYECDKIVIGFPKNMDGSVGERGIKAQKLAKELEARLSITTVLWDERLTTVAAEKMLLQGDVSRKKRKKVIDKVAAVMILQSYLDSIK
ncbi:Holliday junction resolvase RuvX [Desulfitispora alkaliphila]|uniref:Holliday junction resolvase RuvX n=1 Tax=Desulfitispora alkaliphila TaxID=622674 RepID=UPI003D1A4E6A